MFRTFISLFGTITLLRCPSAEFCTDPLGVEDGTIPSEQLTSSSHYPNPYGAPTPDRGRLNTVAEGSLRGSWAAGSNDQNQWIQADIGSLRKVTGVITQGRPEYDQWVTSYEVLHSIGGDNFETIIDASGQVAVFIGNSDRNTAVTNMFHSPVDAQFIRIHPTGWNSHISMRFEVLGCPVETILYNHHCYKFVSNLTTWNDAKAICKSFSSHLITINTVEEVAYFRDIALSFAVDYVWTGLNDIAVEGEPVWLTHDQPTYYEFDDNHDPENMDCFRFGMDAQIRYTSCDLEMGYVCEASSIVYEKYLINARSKSPAAGYVVRSVLAVSSGACSLECGRLESCVSFSFSRSSNECRLSTSTGQSAELEDVQDTDFYVLESTEVICKPLK